MEDKKVSRIREILENSVGYFRECTDTPATVDFFENEIKQAIRDVVEESWTESFDEYELKEAIFKKLEINEK